MLNVIALNHVQLVVLVKIQYTILHSSQQTFSLALTQSNDFGKFLNGQDVPSSAGMLGLLVMPLTFIFSLFVPNS